VEHAGAGIHPLVASKLGGTGLVAAPFRTDRVSGRVFFTQVGELTAEIVPLAEVIAREIGASLDQVLIAQQVREISAREERIRVARDLHDGVLQSLTGIRLELRAVAGDESRLASETRDRLFAIERALGMEQRELRMFIGGLSHDGMAAHTAADAPTLESRLHTLSQRIAAEWKVPVTIRAMDPPKPLPQQLAEAVPLMVHEAVVNALKHAHPSRVAVTVRDDHGALQIVVDDDGRGFPFRGRYDHEALVGHHSAPRSLLDRVTALGGRMAIDSTEAGSRVELRLAV